VTARSTDEHIGRLIDQHVAAIVPRQLGCTELERGDQIAVRAERSEAVDARLQLLRHRRFRDDGAMQPPAAAHVGVRSRIEKLAEVHLAFVGESLRQRNP
jgi:hypothetical protein